MKHSVIVSCLLAALALSGCGSSDPATVDTSGKPGATVKIGPCATDAPGVTKATDLAEVDLDGDGTPDKVKLTSPEGSCPNVVFAELAKGYVSAQVPTDAPPVRAGFGVTLPGHTGGLLVTQQAHPRGGFQLRAYAVGGDELEELTYQGRTIFPFVATDTKQPFSVDCSGSAIRVREAQAHSPIGVMFTWDVKERVYAVKDATVTLSQDSEVADNVLPGQLKERFPELAGGTLFTSCRA